MKTMRFRYVIILGVIAVALNIFNFALWNKSNQEDVKTADAKSMHDQRISEYSNDAFDEDSEFSKSQSYMNAANAFYKKDYEIAINELNVDIEKTPNHAQSYFLLGKIYEDAIFPSGRYFSKMVKNYEKYIELKPNGFRVEHAKLKLAQYYVSVGLTEQNPENLDKAEKYLKSLNQDNSEVKMALGAIYLDRKNFKQAITEFEKSANLQPNELRLKYNSLGLAYIKTGRYGNAENVLKIAIQIEPENKFAHNNLGFVYLRLKKIEGAKAQFREALRIDPEYKNAKDNLEWLNSVHKSK